MKTILLLVSLLSFNLAMASDDVNLSDTSNTYNIVLGKKTVGTVKISSKFVGDNMLESTEIRVTVKCASGYKLSDKFKKSTEMHVYDYGANCKLSQWYPVSNSATIFYRSGKLDDNQRVSVDQSHTLDISFATACLAK